MVRQALVLAGVLTLLLAPALAAQEKRPGRRGGHGDGEIRITPISNDAEVYLRNVRQVTYEGLKSGEGYFSPDQTKIAFQSVP